MTRQYLVSIHDVTPETLYRVHELMERLETAGLLPVTLLVVPGSGWSDTSLRELRGLQQRGAELAGHGWIHRVREIRGWKHRLHSTLISRNAAEHLSLDRAGVRKLMRDCHDWFGDAGLPEPSLYVPPAWALGALPLSELQSLPWPYLETLSGVYCRDRQVFRRLPMVGYETDTLARALSVRGWNALNLAWASDRLPVRLGIHPHDLQLRLAADLEALFHRGGTALSYRDL